MSKADIERLVEIVCQDTFADPDGVIYRDTARDAVRAILTAIRADVSHDLIGPVEIAGWDALRDGEPNPIKAFHAMIDAMLEE